MEKEIKYKLKIIRKVWDSFIWKYKYCRKKIKFTEDIKTNYLSDILEYFIDTLDIIYIKKEPGNQTERFSRNISLLQSIYIQQDFIEELLLIFKCKIVKGQLKKDNNYSINRDIRNELIGHPIRKYSGNFISSTLFNYHSNKNSIVYLRYHRDNDFQSEKKEFLISEIISRHSDFLNNYLEKIIQKLKTILKSYNSELEQIEKIIDQQDFQNLINISYALHESIFEDTYIYDQESLLKINKRKTEHVRYQNFIDSFYKDLKDSLKENRKYSHEIFLKNRFLEKSKIDVPIINLEFIDFSSAHKDERKENVNQHTKPNFSYNLGKIGSKRNSFDFEIHSSSIKEKCSENKQVIDELNHMRKNQKNDIEFYTSLRLIRKILDEE